MPNTSNHALSDSEHVFMCECLTFRLGTFDYGTHILAAQEIRSYAEPTWIANALKMLLGVIHLRGVTVPIIDLHIKLQHEIAVYNGAAVVIILTLLNKVVGSVVDSESNVVQGKWGCTTQAPAVKRKRGTSFITGLANMDNCMLIWTDTESFLGNYAPDASGPKLH